MRVSTVLAPTHSQSQVGVRPITDQATNRVCKLVGIPGAEKKLVQLREIKKGLDISIADLEAQRRLESIYNRALMVCRFTRATSDAFISMAGAMGGKSAKKVSEIYGAATPWAEASGTAIAGGKVDLVDTTAKSLRKGASMVPGGPGTTMLLQSTAVKVEVINSALRSDEANVIKSSADYAVELAASTAKLADEYGDSTKGKEVGKFVTIAKATWDYNDAIGKAFDGLIKDQDESVQRYWSLKSSMVRQAKQLSKQISQLEEFITSCESDLFLNPT